MRFKWDFQKCGTSWCSRQDQQEFGKEEYRHILFLKWTNKSCGTTRSWTLAIIFFWIPDFLVLRHFSLAAFYFLKMHSALQRELNAQSIKYSAPSLPLVPQWKLSGPVLQWVEGECLEGTQTCLQAEDQQTASAWCGTVLCLKGMPSAPSAATALGDISQLLWHRGNFTSGGVDTGCGVVLRRNSQKSGRKFLHDRFILEEVSAISKWEIPSRSLLAPALCCCHLPCSSVTLHGDDLDHKRHPAKNQAG